MTDRVMEPTPDEFDALTAACVAFVRAHIVALDDHPSADMDGASEIAETFRESLPAHGRPLADILQRLELAFAKSFTTNGPGYLAFIPGGGLYASALADYIAAAMNRYTGVIKAAPALSQIEETTVRWLCELMGYPAHARGTLTTGGSLSNLTAITTARIARLPEDFLNGVLYMSEDTHVSVPKAARLAGFPASAVRLIPVDARRRIRLDALESAIAADRSAGRRPFLVCANAGTVATGAIDPLDALAELARAEGLWLHADAAYGGFFRAAEGGAALLRGVERCDSLTLDPHKTLFLPYGTGCVLVRDGDALHRAHETEAAYLRDVAAEGDRINMTDLSPELSRDFRAIRVWLPFVLYGVDAFRTQLTEKLALARVVYERLRADDRFELLDEPQLSIVAFRLRDADDALNAELLRRVNARGRVFLSSTTVDGRYTLRVCVVSYRTHRDRIEDALHALQEEARALGVERPRPR